jgi:hypothetical protein
MNQRELFTTTDEKLDELHAKTEQSIADIHARIKKQNAHFEVMVYISHSALAFLSNALLFELR